MPQGLHGAETSLPSPSLVRVLLLVVVPVYWQTRSACRPLEVNRYRGALGLPRARLRPAHRMQGHVLLKIVEDRKRLGLIAYECAASWPACRDTGRSRSVLQVPNQSLCRAEESKVDSSGDSTSDGRICIQISLSHSKSPASGASLALGTCFRACLLDLQRRSRRIRYLKRSENSFWSLRRAAIHLSSGRKSNDILSSEVGVSRTCSFGHAV